MNEVAKLKARVNRLLGAIEAIEMTLYQPREKSTLKLASYKVIRKQILYITRIAKGIT